MTMLRFKAFFKLFTADFVELSLLLWKHVLLNYSLLILCLYDSFGLGCFFFLAKKYMLTDRGVKKNRPTEKTEKKLTDRQNLIHRLKKQKKPPGPVRFQKA
jgi:hypothetical protein